METSQINLYRYVFTVQHVPFELPILGLKRENCLIIITVSIQIMLNKTFNCPFSLIIIYKIYNIYYN